MKYYTYTADQAMLNSFISPDNIKVCEHCGSKTIKRYHHNDKLVVAAAIVSAESLNDADEKFRFMWSYIQTKSFGSRSGLVYSISHISEL